MPAYKLSERKDELNRWLLKVGAVRINAVEGPHKSNLVFYSIKGRVFIVQEMWDRHGENFSWDMYAPVSQSLSTAETFADAERYLDQIHDAH